MTISETQMKQLLVRDHESVDRLLEAMNHVVTPRLGSGYAIVINEQGKATAVIADSDLRKFFARYGRMPKTIKELSRKDFIFVEEGLTEVEVVESLLEQMASRGWKTVLPVRFVPILKFGYPTGVIDSQDLNFGISAHRDQLVVVGLGYVGLTLALAASSAGISVIGLDSNTQKIELLKRKQSYISEPGIENLLDEFVGSDFLPVSTLTELTRNPGQSWSFILSVPTPLTNEYDLDTSLISDAVIELLPHFQVGDSVIVRSTVPIGTTREIAAKIESALGWSVGKDFYAISAPERTVEGNALLELHELPQVIGGVTANCGQHGAELFQKISKRLVSVSSPEVSEAIKIASNAYRDYTFGFANYLAKVAHSYNLDVNEIVESANFGYLRNSIPKPSPGVGGPCLSKDPYLLGLRGLAGQESPINLARKTNESMTQFVFDHLLNVIPKLLSHEIVIIGLAFKGMPETNDMRNSPSIDLARLFSNLNKPVLGWDAVITNSLNSGDYLPLEETYKPRVFLMMNNHEKNVEKLLSLLENNSDYFWVFDPWRLMVNPKECLRFAPQGFTYISLSNSVEYFSYE